MASPHRFLRNTRIIAALTLASRLLGLAREMVFAHCFSTGGVLSAFRVAFVAPNLARRIFGEGALSSALIPMLSRALHAHDEPTARRLAGAVMTWLALVLSALLVLIEAAVLVARRFTDEPVLDMAAVLMPYMVLICTTAVAGGILNVRGRFAAPAAAPMILNVSIIFAAWLGSRWGGLEGEPLMMVVCVSVLVAGVLQLTLQFVALRRERFLPILTWRWRATGLRRVLGMMLPMVIGLSAVQISTLLDYVIAYAVVRDASGAAVGPGVLGFAQYLYQLPLGVFGIALATAVFPSMAAYGARRDHQALAHVMTRGVRLAWFIACPASIGLILVARPLVAALFERGSFGPAQTTRVAGTLACYALGLVAYFTNHVLVRAYYALSNTGAPMRVAAWMVLVNLVLGLTLVFTALQERGLALATALSALGQTAWLARGLRTLLPDVSWRSVLRGAWRTFAATGVMSAVLVILTSIEAVSSALPSTPVALTLVLVVTGAGVFVAASAVLRSAELREVFG